MINFEESIKFILNYVKEDPRLSIDHVNSYLDKKIAIGISLDNDPIISIEIYPNGVCDMMMIDIDTDNTRYFVNEQFINIEKLKEGIIKFLKYISQ